MKQRAGIAGPDRRLVLNELHRLRHAQARGRRRKRAAFAGLVTLVVSGLTIWMTVESLITLLQSSGSKRWSFALVELVLFGVSVLICVVVLLWLRYARHPTSASVPVLVAAAIASILHIAAAIMNGALVFSWKPQVRSLCTGWGVDLVWNLGDVCASNGTLNGWAVSAGVRLLITLIISVSRLRMFC